MSTDRDRIDGLAGLSQDVVGEHRGWLVRLIVARTGSRVLVDDLLQEIGLAVARAAHHPEREEDVSPWLCTIAVRQCALALRKDQRHRRLLNGVSNSAVDSATRLDDPIYWLLNRERSDLVREALTGLEQEMRELLIWKYVEGMTYGQLAGRLGVPAHVVEYRVVTAKNDLRRQLIELGLGEEDKP